MPASRLQYLTEKYFRQQCSQQEKEELAQLVSTTASDEELQQALTTTWESYETDSEMPDVMSERIMHSVYEWDAPTQPLPLYKKVRIMVRRAAAAALLVAAAGTAFWFINRPAKIAPTTASTEQYSNGQRFSYTRHLQLADGSTVVLKAGSSLQLAAQFNTTARELTLEGEAYFDIAPGANKPFIIKTGQLTTTVLGTAFNIKAYPHQKSITVSVTKGKVKVEANAQLLAVLEANRQISYNTEIAQASEQKVDALALVTDWTKQDMLFDDTNFEAVATLLEKRYGVNIQFKNPKLASCPVHAFFNGTEKLEKILTVLCKVRNADFSRQNDTIIIDGEGCN